MTEGLQVAIVGIIVNAAMTWGIVRTQMAWLRRDVDRLMHRADRESDAMFLAGGQR